MKTLILAVSASLLFVFSAFAAEPDTNKAYGGADVTHVNVDYNSSHVDSFNFVRLRGGYNLTDNFAVEAFVGTNDSDLDYIAGINLKPKIRLRPDTELYGLLGYNHLKPDGGDSDSDVSYGIGLSYDFNPVVAAYVEYTSFYSKNNTDMSGPSLGVKVTF